MRDISISSWNGRREASRKGGADSGARRDSSTARDAAASCNRSSRSIVTPSTLISENPHANPIAPDRLHPAHRHRLVAIGVVNLSRDQGGNITLKTPEVTSNRADGNGSVRSRPTMSPSARPPPTSRSRCRASPPTANELCAGRLARPGSVLNTRNGRDGADLGQGKERGGSDAVAS